MKAIFWFIVIAIALYLDSRYFHVIAHLRTGK